MRRAVAAVAVLAALVLVFVPAARARTGVLVALGDSYSSGEGAGPYDAGAAPCDRSPRAWPRLLGVTAEHHLACTGAVLADVTGNSASADEAPQAARLAQIAAATPVKRVVLTIGGNDVPAAFGPRLATCWLLGPAGCVPDAGAVTALLPALGTRLTAAYRAVQEAAGGAPLLVVGYPDLLPAPSTARVRRRCPWVDRAALRRTDRVQAALDGTIRAAAHDAGADFVSLRHVLRGHELCTAHPWLHAITGKVGDRRQAHPGPRGQAAMARAVARRLGLPLPTAS